MALETQKPTQNKDFDFILNQNPEEGPPKKGPNKKVIAIIILVVATLLVMGVSFFVGSNKKVQKSSQSNTAQNSDKTQQEKASDVIEAFLKKTKSGDKVGAYELFSANPGIPKEFFYEKSWSFLTKLDISTCKAVENVSGVTTEEGYIIRTYACKSKKFDYEYGLEFLLSSSKEGDMSIHYYNLVDLEEA